MTSNVCKFHQLDETIESLKDHYRFERSASRDEWDPIEDSRKFSALYVQLEMVYEPKAELPRRDNEAGRDDEKLSEMSSNDEKLSEIYDVFDGHGRHQNPARVIIIGEAGTGKTTLCQKLVYEYADGEEPFSSRFSGVEFLIFIRCSKLEKKAISKFIIDMIEKLNSNSKQKAFIEYLNENGDKVLFLVDGLDELTTNNEELDKLLKGSLFKGSRIIATTRNEGFTLKRKYCFQSCFKIAELNDHDVDKFVSKHLQQLPERSRREFLNSLPNALSRNPLNLYLLCLLYQGNDGCLPEELSELYKELVQSRAQRLASKKGISDIDISESLLLPLSNIAYDRFKKNKLFFYDKNLDKVWSETDVCSGLKKEDVIKLGLVSTSKEQKELRLRNRYEFVHKSYQEFLCAWFVNYKFKSDKSNGKDSLLEEFSWLLDLDWEKQSVNFHHKLPVQFLLGLASVDDAKLILRNVLKAIRILTINGHTCEAVFQCLKGISSKIFSQISTILVRAMPDEIEVTSRCLPSPYLDILERACSGMTLNEQVWNVRRLHLYHIYRRLIQDQLRVVNNIIGNDLCQLQYLHIEVDIQRYTKLDRELIKTVHVWQESKSLHTLVISMNL